MIGLCLPKYQDMLLSLSLADSIQTLLSLLGSTTTTTVAQTDQFTLTNAWSVSAAITIGANVITSTAGVPRVTVTGGYSGSYVSQHSSTATNTQTTNTQTTITSSVVMLCPIKIPSDTTCTWSGTWSLGHSLPPSQDQINIPVNHTLIGGGIVAGYMAGLLSATVQSRSTTVYVQCKVNGTWVGFGDQPFLG